MDRSPLKTFLIKFLVSCQKSLTKAIRSHGCHQIQMLLTLPRDGVTPLERDPLPPPALAPVARPLPLPLRVVLRRFISSSSESESLTLLFGFSFLEGFCRDGWESILRAYEQYWCIYRNAVSKIQYCKYRCPPIYPSP